MAPWFLRSTALLGILAAAIPSTASLVSNNTEYEYVVIGSGAGGGTLAATLARKGHSVFLIEAGDDHGHNPAQEVPAFVFTGGEDPTMAWSFFVRHYANETQARRDSKFTYRLPDGSLYYGLEPPADAEPLGTLYPRGATLGGSSQINAMNFIKPRNEDWDYLASITGDDSWSAQAMEFYFEAFEHAQYVPEGTPGHGFDGYISSNHNNLTYITGRESVSNVMSTLVREVEGIDVNSTEALGELMQRDVNGANHEVNGVYQLVVSTTGMRRRSGARDYIVSTVDAKKYPLTVSTNSLATRVLFDQHSNKTTPRAYGVEYMVGEGLYGADPRSNNTKSGKLQTVVASKEVIVAGGAFNTPQILKLSGVGPRDELEKFDIPVIVDLPAVGKYLQDHTEAVINVNSTTPWENDPNEPCTMALDETDPCYVEWNNSGTGPYGEAAAPIGLVWNSSVSETSAPDLFYFAWTNSMARGFYPGFSKAGPAPRTWTWDIVKLHVPGDGDHARGTVNLRSKEPRDVPEIVFDWLPGDLGERDLTALVEGAELVYRGFEQLPEPIGPVTRVIPAEGEDVRQNIKDEAFGHHASSSCRMGPKGDFNYCVDSQLRVNGVNGLRVVDASVFPHTPGAFPAVSVYMLGRKAADIISEAAKTH